MKRMLRSWRDLSVMTKGLLLLSIPLLLMLGALLSGWQLSTRVADAEAEARRTLQVQSELQALHKLIVEAATGVRGYLLTGRDDFLQTYWRAKGEIPQTLTRLDGLTSDDGQRAVLNRLRPQIIAKVESLDELRTTGRLLSADELQQHLIDSKRILDAVRGDLEILQRREAELIEERTAAVATSLRRNLWMNAVTVGVAMLIAVLAAAVFYTSIASRVRRIALNSERLLAGDALLPLPHATDELGQVMARLQQAGALLARRAEESREASHAKTEFLSRVSHELRTPLNAILGFAQLLESDQASQADRRAVEQILGAGRHLLSLINELLDISRIESGQLPLAPTGVAVETALEEVGTMVAALARQSGITVHLAPTDPQLQVLADRQRLLQVLLNLASNGIKFNQSGGNLHGCRRAPPARRWKWMWWMTVPAFPEDQRARLFQPFVRLSGGAPNIEGSGLGLAIARLLARAMGGDVELLPDVRGRAAASSCDCRGCRNHRKCGRYAPWPWCRPFADSRSTPRTGGISAAQRDVLLIEDNASNRALVEALVSRRPAWRLHMASTAQEGLDAGRCGAAGTDLPRPASAGSFR